MFRIVRSEEVHLFASYAPGHFRQSQTEP